jgi:hypothetical protein
MTERLRIRGYQEPVVWFWLTVHDTVEEMRRCAYAQIEGPAALDPLCLGVTCSMNEAEVDITGRIFGGWIHLTGEYLTHNYAVHEGVHAGITALRLRRRHAGQSRHLEIGNGDGSGEDEEEFAYATTEMIESVLQGLWQLGWTFRFVEDPRPVNPGRGNPAPRKSPGSEIPPQANPPSENPPSENPASEI